MAESIRQSELRNDNARVMRRVAAGEEFVVTVRGRPVADLVPHRIGDERRTFVPVGDLAAVIEATSLVDSETWRADIRDAQRVFGSDEPSDPFLQTAG